MVRSHYIQYLRTFRQWSRSFLGNRDGAVALVYAISFSALVAVTALAYDIARTHYARAHLKSTIDAIAIGIGAELQNIPVDISTAAIGDTPYKKSLIRIAKSYIIGNIGVDAAAFLNFSPNDVTVTIKYPGTVNTPNIAEISGTVELPFTLAATFFNLDKTQVKASAKVNREVRGMELVLALDTSGSMLDGTKIVALKTAVSSLLDILYAGRETIPDFYASVVPFADDNVNITGYSDWINEQPPSSSPAVDCAGQRMNPNYDNGNDADKNPIPSRFHRGNTCYAETNECIRWEIRGHRWQCVEYDTWVRSRILPLTAEKTIINNRVQDIEPTGATSTNVGLAWAWRTISPNWSGDWEITKNENDEVLDVRPVAYGHEVLDKTIIFMTDGVNTNTDSRGWYDNSADKNDWYEETCAAIKAEGIQVFTIAFAMNEHDEGIYRTCASSESHFFSADNNSELQNAFEAIAAKLSVMKLVE